MKQRLLLTILSLFLLNAAIFADEYTDEQGIVYYYDHSGYTSSVFDGKSVTGAVVIPATINVNGKTYSVTNIKQNAFYGCTVLTSITIPNSVTSIGTSAFKGCTGLTSVTIPNSVINIEMSAFENCTSLTSITLSESLKILERNVFNGCTELTSIAIPNSVQSIGNLAFYNCTGLTSVSIGNSVESIGQSAFRNCTGLTSVTIPNSVTSIEFCAFLGCTGLTSVTIPNSVTSIGQGAFDNCTGLTSVNIGNSLTSIGNFAFSGCTSLTSITVAEDNPTYDSRDNCNSIIETSSNTLIAGCKNSVIPNTVTSIGQGAFDNCTGLTSITIPNSVTTIGNSAFYGCTNLPVIDNIRYADTYLVDVVDKNLSEYIIKEGTRYIGNSAFSGCTGLTSITIPNSVTSIGEYAFSGCTGLTSVNIGNSVTSIGNYAFNGCTGLTSVTIPNSMESIGQSAFYKCTGLTSVNIGNSVTSIGNYAFYGCTGLASVTIPYSVANIGPYDFYNCESLKDVNITISDLSEFANDNNCYNIKSSSWNVKTTYHYIYKGEELADISLPDGIEKIGDYAFYGCTSLTSITIPNSVTKIYSNAFYGCTGLTSIEFPKSITSVGDYAFYGCAALAKVSITDLNAWLNIDFAGSSKNPLIYGGGRLYLKGKEVTNLVIPESVTKIGDYAFVGCSSLTSVTIPKTVTSIGHDAFSRCINLTSVKIPNSVTDIDVGAFYDTPLTSITIPESVTSIGVGAFGYCHLLKTIRCLSDNPSPIDPHAFHPTAYYIIQHIYDHAILSVPKGSKEKYMNTEGWKDFRNILSEIPGSDANLDDEVNTADVMAVYTYIIDGGESVGGVVYEDVNNDKEVNSADVVSIYSYIINGEKNVLDALDDEQYKDSLNIFRWAITADDKYANNPNYAPVNEFFSTYLSYSGGNFSLFIPTDNALKHYYDPISMGFSQPYMLAFNYDERNTSNPISAYAYKYDPNTHQTDDWRMTVTVKPSAINNRLKDMLNAHIIAHDEADEDGILSGKTFYTTKGGAPIKVINPAKGINGGKVQGAWQIEHKEACNIKKIFDQSRKTNGYGNGMTYIIDRPLQSTVHSVYNVLNDNGAENSPYAKFFELCQVNPNVIEEAGFIDEYTSRAEKDAALDDYMIFTSTNPCMDYNVRFFSDSHYTVYVPTNESIEKQIKWGLPTWESISQFIKDAKQEIQTKQSVSGYDATEDIEAYKTKAQAMCAVLINFVKYHFQKNAVYNDIPAVPATTVESMCFDAKANGYITLKVQNAGNGMLKVTDKARRTRTVDATRNNILTRDMQYDKVGASASIIETSSFAVLHQIDGVLNFFALPKGRYDSLWDTLEDAKSFIERYPVK